MRYVIRFLDWFFSSLFGPHLCPYCNIELEVTWSGSDMCPKCGYDAMTGKRYS